MGAKKVTSPRVQMAHSVVYYDKVHQSPKGVKWQFNVYFLNDAYILVMQNGDSVFAFAFTDLTTMRYEMDRMIRDLESGRSEK